MDQQLTDHQKEQLEKLARIEGKPAAEVLDHLLDRALSGRRVSPPASSVSLMDLEGLGASLWEGLDAAEYVDGLRNEWKSR